MSDQIDSLQFNVRLARASDMALIDALYARSYPKLLKPDYAPSVLVTIVPIFSKAQPRLVVSGSFYVAESETGDIVGAGGWTKRGPMGENQRALGHMRHFATAPRVVRQGVGTALMSACVNHAKAEGMNRLSSYSTITAVPFYEAHGFEVKGEMSIEFTEGIHFPAIWMERKL